MNIVNAAAAAGWAAQWLTGWVAHDEVFANQAFSAQSGQTVAGIIHIGAVGSEAPDRPRPDPAKIIEWIPQ